MALIIMAMAAQSSMVIGTFNQNISVTIWPKKSNTKDAKPNCGADKNLLPKRSLGIIKSHCPVANNSVVNNFFVNVAFFISGFLDKIERDP